MNFLINCSNLKAGGGLQVADSICCSLGKYPQHRFYVVLSSALRNTKKKIESIEHVKIFEYNIQNNYRRIILGYCFWTFKMESTMPTFMWICSCSVSA